MADENEEVVADGDEQPKSGSGKLIIIIVVLLLVVGGGGAAAFLMMGGEEEVAEEGFEEEESFEEQLEARELEPFVVNLKGGRSFLKLTVMLEYDVGLIGGTAPMGEGEEAMTGLPGVLGSRNPMIRDAILTVLSSKSATTLLTVEGKEQLKEELVESINDAIDLDEAPVTGVYFLEFLVQ